MRLAYLLASVLCPTGVFASPRHGDLLHQHYARRASVELTRRLTLDDLTVDDTTWNYSGCRVDDMTGTLLSGSYKALSTNTPSVCAALCLSQGYIYAGVEYSSRCYCGNALDKSTGLGATVADTACSRACTGDKTLTCGHANRMQLYRLDTTNLIASGSTQWAYQGCIQDTSSGSVLTGSYQTSSTLTPSSCIATCLSQGYSMAGVEYSSRCYCGDKVNTGSDYGSAVADSACSRACSGDSTLTCGQYKKMQLYSLVSGTVPAKTITSGSTAWTDLGCYQDGADRLLQGFYQSTTTNTPSTCIAVCKTKGFAYAGVEYSSRCYCGNSLSTSTGLGTKLADSACSRACTGDATLTCGQLNKMQLYQLTTGSVTTTSASSSSTMATSTSSAAPSATTGPGGCPAYGSAAPTLSAPKSTGTKAVFSHFMVGNTYPYVQADWLADIKLALNSAGVDAFALNLGTDYWQPTQIAYAYAAAKSIGTSFKLFFSFDMTVFSCGDISNSIYNYVLTYASHPNQYFYKGKVFVSTFAGESCGDAAWTNLRTMLSAQGVSIYFVPGFFSQADWTEWSSYDGILNWNSAWSMDAKDITTATDTAYVARIGSSKSYLPGVSPLFFTHYGVNSYNKNWLFQSDGWQYAIRWEQIVAMRDKTDFVEQITWNDYGESHYIGPIAGAQPNSQSWVDGFDHQAFLAVTKYYAQAFKTGVYPTISCDVIYLMSRPHDNTAVASADSAGAPPTLGQGGAAGSYTAETNSFFALVFATSSATVKLTSGSSSKTFTVPAGITRVEAPTTNGYAINAQMTRNGQAFIDFTPSGFKFSATTTEYNFNYKVWSSADA